MAKNIRLLLTVCLLAIAGLIVLQFYWIKNYYQTSLFHFEREVNLAFEDAVKKDFQLRCDTIEQLLVAQLMDTSAFTIQSRYSKVQKVIVHHIYNAKDKKDYTSFSSTELPDSLVAGDIVYKRKIAQQFARNLRTEDLENHVVYYRIQSLGHFVTDKVKRYGFDTSRLRPVLRQRLSERNIYTGFSFYVTNADSLLSHTKLPDALAQNGFVATKAQPTYKWWAYNEQYVRVVFENPIGYIFVKMEWILAGSLLLIILVALCIWLLLKALFHEKKLAIIKNDFINNITHELKTPVATISAAIEALQGSDISKEKNIRYLQHAQHETGRLSKLIDNILNISLYEKNTIRLQPEPVLVEKTIQEIIDGLKIATHIPIQYQYKNDTGTNSVVADKQLFQQALTNVLDNAVKYSGNEVVITVTCSTGSGYFVISCSDKGNGISASSMPHIFEKFYREPKPDHAIKGHGLGLSYVQKIMEAHHGTIEIKSIKGKGTTVILSWPL
ncbi:MAG: HAMP domain-containing histidine kinase [Chitinophagaceae bacterium]|nr:MAG: HAMP domain-containing histidine kinase [Chitinophagaceae bacterium]